MVAKKGMKRYSVETKLEAVRLFLEEGKTQAEIAEALGVHDSKRVEKWVNIFRHEEHPFRKRKGRRPKQPDGAESVEEELKRLRMENDLLKKLQAELRKEAFANRNIGSSTAKEKRTK